MGIFEKRRFRNFLIWVNQFKESDPSTYQGMPLVLVSFVSNCRAALIVQCRSLHASHKEASRIWPPPRMY